MSRFALAIVVAIVSIGCGGNSNAPTATSVPNVQGSYHGGYSVASCAPSGGFPFPSSPCPPTGTAGGFNLRVTQSDRALRAFVFVCWGEINEAIGSVGNDGTITLTGQDAVGTWAPILLSEFHATVSGNSMTGSFGCTTNPGTAFAVSMTGTLKDVVLVSTDPNVPF
jgi:hypothetical protein